MQVRVADTYIARAHREGTSLILEGTQLLPALYHDHPHLTHFMVLEAPAGREHRQRLLSSSQCKRQLDDDTISKIAARNAYYVKQAESYNIPSFVFRTLEDVLPLMTVSGPTPS